MTPSLNITGVRFFVDSASMLHIEAKEARCEWRVVKVLPFTPCIAYSFDPEKYKEDSIKAFRASPFAEGCDA